MTMNPKMFRTAITTKLRLSQTIRPLQALVAVTLTSLALATHAQTAYRCGNSYSQQPCTDGKAVAVDDARSGAQKAQTDAAARRDARTADTLERERQRQESRPVAGYVAPPQAVSAPEEATSTPRKKRRTNAHAQTDPRVFKAQVPRPPKEPKSTKSPKTPAAPGKTSGAAPLSR